MCMTSHDFHRYEVAWCLMLNSNDIGQCFIVANAVNLKDRHAVKPTYILCPHSLWPTWGMCRMRIIWETFVGNVFECPRDNRLLMAMGGVPECPKKQMVTVFIQSVMSLSALRNNWDPSKDNRGCP